MRNFINLFLMMFVVVFATVSFTSSASAQESDVCRSQCVDLNLEVPVPDGMMEFGGFFQEGEAILVHVYYYVEGEIQAFRTEVKLNRRTSQRIIGGMASAPYITSLEGALEYMDTEWAMYFIEGEQLMLTWSRVETLLRLTTETVEETEGRHRYQRPQDPSFTYQAGPRMATEAYERQVLSCDCEDWYGRGNAPSSMSMELIEVPIDELNIVE